jgi:hypothetical protein
MEALLSDAAPASVNPQPPDLELQHSPDLSPHHHGRQEKEREPRRSRTRTEDQAKTAPTPLPATTDGRRILGDSLRTLPLLDPHLQLI